MTYRTVPVEPEAHRADLIRLLETNLTRASGARFDWFHRKGLESPTTFVAQTEPDAVAVGSASLLPLALEAGGGTRRGAVAVDFNVDRAHRAYGPALKLQRALVASLAENGIDVLWGFPNAQSAPVFKRVGYRELGQTRRWAKVLRSEYVLARHLRSVPLRRLVASSVDGAVCAQDAVNAWLSPSRVRLRCEPWALIDDRFDRLWERGKRGRRFLVRRDSRFLSWRYAQCPLRQYSFFAAVEGDGVELRGYIVHHREEESLVVADFFWEDETVGRFLFRRFFSFARAEGARSVFVTALENRALGDFLSGLGFRPRESNRAAFLFAGEGNTRFSDWADPEAWYLTDGDLDL